jgi:hypothetical protein
MKHVLFEKATEAERRVAIEAADWLLDSVATATQDRRFLRGEKQYDEVAGEAILANGIIACLRAIRNMDIERTKHETGE